MRDNGKSKREMEIKRDIENKESVRRVGETLSARERVRKRGREEERERSKHGY